LQPPRDITALLAEWRQGDATAVDRLIPLVYDELHRVAARAMQRESPGHTLQTTALVHETYLRMVDQKGADWQNRAQFFGIAAQVMRRVLVDHARERLAEKRGGGARRVSLENVHGKPGEAVDVLGLDGALERLHVIDPLQSRVVELRYFTGLNIEETADALDISASTVKREWAIARAWLRRELS
jgi:RNA polymerase sigma factor (TIGR02999 family)